jgi:hypothetical protein
MPSLSNANFGPLIAYLIPGVTALLGISEFSPAVRAWFAAPPADAPTISGFLYLTVASLAVGMTVTAIRWAVVDTVHALTGLPPPQLDFSRLAGKVDAFNLLISIHYVHFQFYSNMFIATAIAYGCYRVHSGVFSSPGWVDVLFIVLELIFFATSRDTLRKYYDRSRQLLSEPSVASHLRV